MYRGVQGSHHKELRQFGLLEKELQDCVCYCLYPLHHIVWLEAGDHASQTHLAGIVPAHPDLCRTLQSPFLLGCEDTARENFCGCKFRDKCLYHERVVSELPVDKMAQRQLALDASIGEAQVVENIIVK